MRISKRTESEIWPNRGDYHVLTYAEEGFSPLSIHGSPLGVHKHQQVAWASKGGMTMQKRIITMTAAALLSGLANALPLEAIGSFFAKVPKGGAAKEAAVAGRAAEGAAGAKGVEHLAVGDAAKAGSVLPAIEPKPDLASDVVAKNRADATYYKTLRAAAGKGDATAMMKMSEMTTSGKVSDPGEPWRGYWMFQAARLGSQAAARKSRDECSSGEIHRVTDRWFDSACGSADGRSFYVKDKMPGAYLPYRPEFLVNPIDRSGVKQ